MCNAVDYFYDLLFLYIYFYSSSLLKRKKIQLSAEYFYNYSEDSYFPQMSRILTVFSVAPRGLKSHCLPLMNIRTPKCNYNSYSYFFYCSSFRKCPWSISFFVDYYLNLFRA